MNYERVYIIDSHPGSGKTSYAIQKINETDPDTKIIYITPFLPEVQRMIDSCPNKNFVQPESKAGRGRKLNHLINLVYAGKNIASTHALFKLINDELIEALRQSNYVLYLDEVFQTVEQFDTARENLKREIKESFTRKDVETLIAKEIIKVEEEDDTITWIDNDKQLSQYDMLRNLANRKLLYYVSGSLLLWTFPIEVFRPGIFNEIFILTHQFDCQLQAYYYNYFGLEYRKYHVLKDEIGKYQIALIENDDHEREWKNQIRGKIHIVEDRKLNRIGSSYYDSKNRLWNSALSKSWYDSNQRNESIRTMRNNLDNFFRNVAKSKAEQRLWTCFKDHKDQIKSRNISKKYWLACNARSTNEHRDKTVLAYLINRYLDTFFENFFQKKGIHIDENSYALSEMIQWIWRSAIRDGQEITIYIPSERMRNLLKDYLYGG